MMIPEQKQLLRHNILEQLDSAKPCGMAIPALAVGIEMAGFKRDCELVARELDYLCSKNFVEIKRGEISAGAKLFKITAAGTEYLEA